jgi:hypothetical protein
MHTMLELIIFDAIAQLAEGWGNFVSILATLLADVLGLIACFFLVRVEPKAGTAS